MYVSLSGFVQTQTLTQGVTVTLEKLNRELEMARENDDGVLAKRLEFKIQKIERDRVKAKEKYEQSGRLNNINQRNRDMNIQMDIYAGKRKRETEKEASGSKIDPFARFVLGIWRLRYFFP